MNNTKRKKVLLDVVDTGLGCFVCLLIVGFIGWKLGLPRMVKATNEWVTIVNSAPDLSATEQDARLNEYFKEGNENALQHRLGEPPIDREVSARKRQKVIDRDNGKCVVCGTREPLQVDHRRALQNGGDNSYSNLATLCPNCHGLKGTLDNSVRRKRKKLVGRQHQQ